MLTVRTSRFLLVLCAATLAAAGCGSPTGNKRGARIKPELVRLRGTTAHSPAAVANRRHSPAAAVNLRLAGAPGDAFATTDLNIESLRVPITGISLENSSAPNSIHAQAYECTAGDCLVDLASPTFERNLLQTSAVTVPVGTYDRVVFSFCRGNETTHVVYLTASVSLNGTTYYTRPDGSLATGAPAQPAAIRFSGCANGSMMPYPVAVTDNGVVQQVPDEDGEVPTPVGEASLRLYFATDDIAWAAMGATHSLWFSGACALPSEQAEAGTPYVCVGYPVVGSFLGTTTIPTVERYSMDIASSVTLFTDGPAIYGGYLRRHLRSAADVEREHLSATGALYSIAVNTDGSLNLQGYVGATGPEWAFPAFRRESHSGTYRDHYQVSRSYSATRLP